MLKTIFTIAILLSSALFSCQSNEPKTMKVLATAYNSLPAQTHHLHPSITAWGDTLKPGMKAIAVSRDLIDTGLIHGTKVKIEGLEGEYVVLDKMNRRWTQKIDIYMGTNSKKAVDWGIKEVTISWYPEEGSGGH